MKPQTTAKRIPGTENSCTFGSIRITRVSDGRSVVLFNVARCWVLDTGPASQGGYQLEIPGQPGDEGKLVRRIRRELREGVY
jgi:hypothetical protein